MTPTKAFLSLLLLLFSFMLSGQEMAINEFQTDTARINNYFNIIAKIYNINPDSAGKLGDSMLLLSQKHHYIPGLYNSYNLKGILAWMRRDINTALDYYRKALALADSTGVKKNKAKVLSNMGLAFRHSFQNDSALVYMNKAIDYSKTHQINDVLGKVLADRANFHLTHGDYIMTARAIMDSREVAEQLNDTGMFITTYITSGILYLKVNRFDDSYQAFFQAITLDSIYDEMDFIASSYLNLGELFFRVKKDYDSARYYYDLAASRARYFQKPGIVLTNDINIGNIFLDQKELDSAFFYYFKAYSNPLIKKYPQNECAVLVNLGQTYLLKKQYKKAQTFLQEGFRLSEELGLLEFKKNALYSLYQLDSLNGHLPMALDKFFKFKIISDSLHASTVENKMAILNFEKEMAIQKYNNTLLLNENQQKTRKLSNQRKLIYVILTAVLVLAIVLYFLYLSRLKRRKLHLELLEKHRDLRLAHEELKVTNETLETKQNQLRDMNMTKDKFFSILGHDLKSPFNSLLGMLSLLDDQWDSFSDEEKHDHIRSLLSSSEQTYHLLTDLLEWGKTQQGLIKPTPVPLNVKSVTIKIKELFSSQIAGKQQHLAINVPEETEITTDLRLFSQIIQNLLNNAIKYTPVGGSISIIAHETKREVKVCVKDTGIGIPVEITKKIFSLNADFNRPGTENEVSTGMGLILCKEYADLIGATLTVESVEHSGSTFCLCFQKK